METFLRRNFKVKGNVLSLYKPVDTEYTKLVAGIEVQLWHKAPMTKIFLGKAFTDTSGDFVVEFEADSPAAYIVDGKISDVFIEAWYNGVLLSNETPPNLLQGLVAYWKLDETSGTSAMDITGNGHVGTLTGATPPGWAAGKIDNGLVCYGGSSGGTTSYMEVTLTNDLTFGAGDFTIALWMKLNSIPDVSCMIIYTGDIASSGFYFEYAPGYINIFVSGGLSSIPNTFTTGVWNHVVIRRRGGYQIECLVNNKSILKYNYPAVIHYPLGTILFGNGDFQNLDGMLDEIGIWKGHGLSNEEVGLLYNSGIGKQFPF